MEKKHVKAFFPEVFSLFSCFFFIKIKKKHSDVLKISYLFAIHS